MLLNVVHCAVSFVFPSFPAVQTFSSTHHRLLNLYELSQALNDSLFELYEPEGSPQMQVLFFNGLQLEDSFNQQFSTWSCGDGSCWPQTWFVKEFPAAHVLSVSYNGSIRKDSEVVLDMYRVGENLTSDLLQEDIGQLPDCPVIMVGHSFGGLIMKQVYRHAHEELHSSREGFKKAQLEKFLGNVRGVFYYATPHRGSKLMDNLAKSVKSHPLLKYFQTLSTDAARLNESFEKICGKYGVLNKFGLAEGLPTKLVRVAIPLTFDICLPLFAQIEVQKPSYFIRRLEVNHKQPFTITVSCVHSNRTDLVPFFIELASQHHYFW
jgi:hypothetical protein